jgi:hypothetical protein
LPHDDGDAAVPPVDELTDARGAAGADSGNDAAGDAFSQPAITPRDMERLTKR